MYAPTRHYYFAGGPTEWGVVRLLRDMMQSWGTTNQPPTLTHHTYQWFTGVNTDKTCNHYLLMHSHAKGITYVILPLKYNPGTPQHGTP